MFAVVTIFLQHRSVWVATAAGLAWLAIRTSRSFTVAWLSVAAAGAVTLGLVVIADPNVATTVESLVSGNVQEVQSRGSTWEWRVQGFAEATDRAFASDVTDMVIGPPAGWAANSNASFASIHIHDRYVDTLAFYGVFGLAVLLAWVVVLAKRVGQGQQLGGSGGSGSPLLQALLLSELLYLVPYFGGMLQGAALGLIWLAASRTLSPRTGRVVLLRAVSPCERETAMR